MRLAQLVPVEGAQAEVLPRLARHLVRVRVRGRVGVRVRARVKGWG